MRVGLIIGVVFLLTGCAREVTDRTFPARSIIPVTASHAINLGGNRLPLKILYLGCGHLVFDFQGSMLMTDPYFSIQPFSPGGKIRSEPGDFLSYQRLVAASGLDLTNTQSVWLAHTHYDHMMDIPLLLRKSVIPSSTAIYGNSFVPNILHNFISPGQYHVLGPDVVYQRGLSNKGKWVMTSPSIRVLPIRSEHAPHLKVGPVKIHLMQGRLKEGYFKEELKTDSSRTKKNAWREGCVYSFLIDFLKGDSVEYRIFVQTSSTHYPVGQPPPELLKEKPVDIALVCLASANTVKPYPIEMLQDLKPKATIFIHWEDFFERAEFGNHKLVRLTNFKKIVKRMNKAGLPMTPDKYVMPQPGTLVTID